MGDKSWLMAGEGNSELLNTAPHGASRSMSRGKSKGNTLHDLDTVLPIDMQKLNNSGRSDIRDIIKDRLREEAPDSYKDVETVVSSTEKFNVARRIASHQPLVTIKAF